MNFACSIFIIVDVVFLVISFILRISIPYVIFKILLLDVMNDLYLVVREGTGDPAPMISDTHHKIIMNNADRLNSAIIYDRDYNYNFFGFKVIFVCSNELI